VAAVASATVAEAFANADLVKAVVDNGSSIYDATNSKACILLNDHCYLR
jgi:hypothetical protein